MALALQRSFYRGKDWLAKNTCAEATCVHRDIALKLAIAEKELTDSGLMNTMVGLVGLLPLEQAPTKAEP